MFIVAKNLYDLKGGLLSLNKLFVMIIDFDEISTFETPLAFIGDESAMIVKETLRSITATYNNIDAREGHSEDNVNCCNC